MATFIIDPNSILENNWGSVAIGDLQGSLRYPSSSGGSGLVVTEDYNDNTSVFSLENLPVGYTIQHITLYVKMDGFSIDVDFDIGYGSHSYTVGFEPDGVSSWYSHTWSPDNLGSSNFNQFTATILLDGQSGHADVTFQNFYLSVEAVVSGTGEDFVAELIGNSGGRMLLTYNPPVSGGAETGGQALEEWYIPMQGGAEVSGAAESQVVIPMQGGVNVSGAAENLATFNPEVYPGPHLFLTGGSVVSLVTNVYVPSGGGVRCQGSAVVSQEFGISGGVEAGGEAEVNLIKYTFIPTGGAKVGGPSYPNGRKYRSLFTLPASSNVLTSFPVPFKVVVRAGLTVNGLSITDTLNNPLPAELVDYNPATGLISGFVRLNTSTDPQDLYLYYGG